MIALRMLLIGVALLLTSCASTPSARDTKWLPLEARATPLQHVIVTVRNETSVAALGVGSTPRGYGATSAYTASREARDEARALAKQYKLREVASWPIPMLDVYCLVYRIDQGADRDVVMASLKSDPRVESAQPLTSFSTQSEATAESHYNDTYARLQNNLAQLAVPQAQRWSLGNGVRVAVIDTGVAIDHADLQGRIGSWRNFIDDDAPQFRRDRHGTAVAGVIAAVANNNVGIAGIAPQVKVLAYKACWETASQGAAACNTFTLAQALTAAINANVDIVNLSLAGPSDPLLARIIRGAQRMGIIFIGAASAEGSGFPIDIEGVIGVEALESSVPGRNLIAAPGRDIFTLTPANHYDAASGSSLAAAEVTAIVALLRSRDSRLGADRARSLLLESARPVSTPEGMRKVINACEAIKALAPGKSCNGTEIPRQARRGATGR